MSIVRNCFLIRFRRGLRGLGAALFLAIDLVLPPTGSDETLTERLDGVGNEQSELGKRLDGIETVQLGFVVRLEQSRDIGNCFFVGGYILRHLSFQEPSRVWQPTAGLFSSRLSTVGRKGFSARQEGPRSAAPR